MERLQESIDSGDRIAIGAWLQLASQLIEIFTNVKVSSLETKIERLMV